MYRLYPYLINTFEDSNDQLDTFNNLLLSAIINQNTPLKGVNLKRPPAPWMKDLHISALQKQRDQLQFEAHKDQIHSKIQTTNKAHSTSSSYLQ